MKRNRTRVATEVFLNVYDLTKENDFFYYIGLGFFHTGVEINGVEYSFGESTGIAEGVPKEASGAYFRESIRMGEVYMTNAEITKVIDDLRSEYRGGEYHMIFKNCNNFSYDLCKQLLGVGIPSYINRMAYIASWFSCCIPRNFDQFERPVPVTHFSGRGNRLDSSSQVIDHNDIEYQRQMRLRALEHK